MVGWSTAILILLLASAGTGIESSYQDSYDDLTSSFDSEDIHFEILGSDDEYEYESGPNSEDVVNVEDFGSYHNLCTSISTCEECATEKLCYWSQR